MHVYPSLEVMWQVLTASRNGCQATGQHTEYLSEGHLAVKMFFNFKDTTLIISDEFIG